MKKLIFFLFVLIAEFSFSQTKINDTVIQSYNLKGKAWHSWQGIDSVWHYNTYLGCMTDYKLKLSCAKCESVYLDVIFQIDSTGKLSDYKVVNEKMCGGKFSPDLKFCFLEFFINYNFPVELRRMKIQVRLGNSLKC